VKDGRTNVNDFSIGIELVNLNDGMDPFLEQQIEAMRGLLKRHPRTDILLSTSFLNYECAEPPGRKSDRSHLI